MIPHKILHQLIFDAAREEGYALSSKPIIKPVDGGSINTSVKIEAGASNLFCKINSATKFPHLFQREAEALALIQSSGCILTPKVLACKEYEGYQLLLLEWIEEGKKTEAFWESFGEQLACMHACTNKHFGLGENNYMGAVPQQNNFTDNWPAFFFLHRLLPLVTLCKNGGLLSQGHVKQFDQLYTLLQDIFPSEPPSLLHGDLWSGNFICNKQEQAVLIDPAIYYGHRSMDMGMITLFGGFEVSFYEAYHYHFPLPANYKVQWEVCNLYPLLIHLHLFGNAYLGRVAGTLQAFQ